MAGRTDWRATPASLTYTPITLPTPVEDALNALVQCYGLPYAASDLLVDSHGRWYFVDLNPAGQYRWPENELPDLGITQALAQLLEAPRVLPAHDPAEAARTPTPSPPRTLELAQKCGGGLLAHVDGLLRRPTGRTSLARWTPAGGTAAARSTRATP